MTTIPDAPRRRVARASVVSTTSPESQRAPIDATERASSAHSRNRAPRARFIHKHARTHARTHAPTTRRAARPDAQTLWSWASSKTLGVIPAPSGAAARCPASSPRPRDAPSRAWSRARLVAASSPANTSNSATMYPRTAATSASLSPVSSLARPRPRSRTTTDGRRSPFARAPPEPVDDGFRTRTESACTASSWRR